MKRDVFEKAKSLNSSIKTIKNRKEKIEQLKKNENKNSKPPIIFGFQSTSTNFVTLSGVEIEYFANYLLKKCEDEIKFLEDEFDKL